MCASRRNLPGHVAVCRYAVLLQCVYNRPRARITVADQNHAGFQLQRSIEPRHVGGWICCLRDKGVPMFLSHLPRLMYLGALPVVWYSAVLPGWAALLFLSGTCGLGLTLDILELARTSS